MSQHLINQQKIRLTQKLINSLNRVFNKDPNETLALRFAYAGEMNWQVLNDRLTINVSGGGGGGASLNINLNDYTFTELSDFMRLQPGYSVTFFNAELADLNATILLDSVGVQGTEKGDQLYAHQSLLWVWFDALASELNKAQQAITQLTSELVIGTASHDWLGEWGKQYAVDPIVGETDSAYAIRIISEVIELKSNNRVLEKAIEDQTGIQVSVVDMDWWYQPQLMLDLGFIPGELAPGSSPAGGYPYWGNPANNQPVVCSFAVILGIVDISSLDQVTIVTIKNIVSRYKAAGTHGRYYGPSGTLLNTNTLGENTNDLVVLSGPLLRTYREITL